MVKQLKEEWEIFLQSKYNDVATRPVPGPVRPVIGHGTQLPSEILPVYEFTSNTKPAHPMSPCQ